MTSDPHTLVGPYVLDAVSDDERHQFEQHLEICADCRAEAGELTATAALLARTTVEEPPASLRRTVLAEIPRTRQLAPDVVAITRPAWRRHAATLAVAAAVLVAVLLGGTAIAGQRQADRAEDRAAVADRRASEAERIAAVTAAPDARTIVMTGRSGRMRVVTSAFAQRSVVVATGLDALPSDQAYAIWFIDDEGAHPAGLFRPRSDGSVRKLVDGVPAADLGITVEPEQGSPRPTGPVVASGTA